MQKLQILFPEPDLRRLRRIAAAEDRPVSELIRRATEAWLDRRAERRGPTQLLRVPTFQGGPVLEPAADLRKAAWADRCADPGVPQ